MRAIGDAVVIHRLRSAFRFARTDAFIPRISTIQTSEHFFLREFVGTSRPRIGVLTVVFALEVAAIRDPNGFPAARPFKQGKMHR